jgi:hypothetical protein
VRRRAGQRQSVRLRVADVLEPLSRQQGDALLRPPVSTLTVGGSPATGSSAWCTVVISKRWALDRVALEHGIVAALERDGFTG